MAQTANNAANGAATTETVLYTAPSGGNDLYTIVQNLTVCNGTASSVTFNIWRSIGGGAAATADRIYFEHPLASKITFECTMGIALKPTDEIRIQSSVTDVSFNISVLEVDST